MDELFPLIFWLFAGLAGLIIKAVKGSKKQQTQQQQQQQRGPARQQPTAQARKPAPAAAKPQPPRPTPQPVQPHVNVPLEAHMHEPEMGEEGTGNLSGYLYKSIRRSPMFPCPWKPICMSP